MGNFPRDYVRVYFLNERGQRQDDGKYITRRENYQADIECGADDIVAEEITIDSLTIRELVEYLEEQAEGANYHHLIDIYGWLANQVTCLASPEAAKNLLIRVAEEGAFIW